MRPLLLALLLAAPALAGERPRPEDYCTDRNGDRVDLGGLTCIAAGCVPPYLARCEMSLNNPIWRKVQEGCPAVSSEPVPATPERDAS